MSTDAWPLSAATTQVLADLREDGAPSTSAQTISRLAVKELILRGHIRILEAKKRRMRSTKVIVAIAPTTASATLPAPLGLLLAHLPQTNGEDLSSVIKAVAKRHTTLFSTDLKEAAIADLRANGLVEDRVKKVMRVWTTTYPGPTERGRNGIAHARERIRQADDLRLLVHTDIDAAGRSARALGALVLLSAGGLAATAMIAQRLRDQLRRGDRSMPEVAVEGFDFDVLAACADALGDAIESLGGGDFADAIDSTFDAAVGAIDSGIDSGISDGGGDGGSGGDGGGCGGGGD